jgi:hypothetical protein
MLYCLASVILGSLLNGPVYGGLAVMPIALLHISYIIILIISRAKKKLHEEAKALFNLQ